MKNIFTAAFLAALLAIPAHYAVAADCYGMDENLNSVPVDCSTGERIYSPAEKAAMAAQRRKEAAARRAAEEKKKEEEEAKAKAEAEAKAKAEADAKAKAEAEAKKEAERKASEERQAQANAAANPAAERQNANNAFPAGIKKVKIGRKIYSVNSVYFSGDTALIETSQKLPKWELSGYFSQPSFADEAIGYYGKDVEAGSVKAAYGGTLSYSLRPWLAIGAGYEAVGKKDDDYWNKAVYSYKGWMFRMKLTLNPSHTFRIYLPVSAGQYKYKREHYGYYSVYVPGGYYGGHYDYYSYSRNEEKTKTVITGGGGIEIGLSRNVAVAGECLFPLHQGGSPGKLKNQLNARLNYRW